MFDIFPKKAPQIPATSPPLGPVSAGITKEKSTKTSTMEKHATFELLGGVGGRTWNDESKKTCISMKTTKISFIFVGQQDMRMQK